MDNNLLEMILKMMSPPANNQTQNSFVSSYPQDNFDKTNQFAPQNNLLPLVLSLLNKSPQQNIFSSEKKEENKKAEVSSASNDEILL